MNQPPCAADPELWFSDERDEQEQAKAICDGCPVRVECLRLALTNEAGKARQQRFGVWGGLTPYQRAKYHKGVKPTPPIRHGSVTGARVHRKRGEKPCQVCLEAERKKNHRTGAAA